jgi:hypothetical protein
MIEINKLDKGVYCIGDPFKILPSKIYEGIWGSEHKYKPGLYSAFSYQFLIYETHYENTTIYKDNLDRTYDIESNNICIAHIDIVNESIKNELFTIESLTKLIVYQNKDKLYINIDDIEFNINIGKEDLIDNDSDNESTNSLDKFVENYSLEKYNEEYCIENEEYENDSDIDIDKILEKGSKTNKEEDDNEHSNEEHTHEYDEYQDYDEDENSDEDKNENKEVKQNIFFKKR